ncbi:MAG: NAD(P)-binding protein [Gemmatimonadetes bacterium]|nr:NAD(P)-binding protein [Gemmatimonadota bacterium]
MKPGDRDFGLDRSISRRDFLDGVAVALGGALAAPGLAQAQGPAPYPPALTGLRGSHEGAFEAFHALRDGTLAVGTGHDTGERYDLVIVGAGISGLAAAHYFLAAHPRARILILDNHDDFGGHARRNEFSHGGRTWIGYGGTQSIDSPLPYSPVAAGLIESLGIDVASYRTVLDGGLHRSLGLDRGFFFDRETFGADRLVRGGPTGSDAERFLAEAPVSPAVRRDVLRLQSERFDPWPGLDPVARRLKLARTSYAEFLTSHWRVDPGVLPLFDIRTHGLFGAGIDAVPAQDAFGLGLPGFQGMELAAEPGPGQNYDSMGGDRAEPYYYHFPDGNASIARLLVRRLIPGAIPGKTAADVVTARADYRRLDRPGQPVRIRLSSPVLSVRHDGPAEQAGAVRVTYLQGADQKTVIAGQVVLACWHTAIPHLCPELPAPQRQALGFAIKVPLVYTNVFVRRWTAFTRLGVSGYTAPAAWHPTTSLDAPVSVGQYRHSRSPEEPTVLHLAKSACQPGLPIREQHRVGRNQLFTTPFVEIERAIRSDLGRALGPGGFDPATDILGITVNRWPHGYAYQYNSLFDEFWVSGGETPCEVARRPYGRIAIANADAAAYSYTDAAIDQAHRAVTELTGIR